MPDIIIETNAEYNDKKEERLAAYARFLAELQKKNITPYKVSKDTGIATATLSDWKKGVSMPKNDKMDVLSKYLNISTDYIIYGEEPNNAKANAMLDVQISEDPELKEAIKKYYTLDDRKKKHVLELIDLLYTE